MIRLATPQDIPELGRLHHASIRELCGRAYAPEQIEAWIASLTPEAYRLMLSMQRVVVAEREGQLAGFGSHDPAQGFIHASYVKPELAQQHFGTSLLKDMEAHTPTALPLHLHATLNAVGFYEKYGFARGELGSNQLPSGVELPCIHMMKAGRASWAERNL
jgi:ribosomal protein S18 acetylase RimI-like enzyme